MVLKCAISEQYSQIPALSLKRKLTIARRNLTSSSDAFVNLDATVPKDLRQIWKDQETKALLDRLSNPKEMDIFEVQLEKGKPHRGR